MCSAFHREREGTINHPASHFTPLCALSFTPSSLSLFLCPNTLFHNNLYNSSITLVSTFLQELMLYACRPYGRLQSAKEKILSDIKALSCTLKPASFTSSSLSLFFIPAHQKSPFIIRAAAGRNRLAVVQPHPAPRGMSTGYSPPMGPP